jgi:hypothetical protein
LENTKKLELHQTEKRCRFRWMRTFDFKTQNKKKELILKALKK